MTGYVYRGHLVLVSTFVLNLVASVTTSFGLYLGPLMKTFSSSSSSSSDVIVGIGESTLVLYCTLPLLSGLISSLVAGLLQDTLHRNNTIHLLFSVGGALVACGMFVSSLSHTAFGLLCGSIVTGMGLGMGGYMAGGICVLWFEKSRGRMLLYSATGGGVGTAFFAWATAALLDMYGDDGDDDGDGDGDDVVVTTTTMVAAYYDDPWRPTMQCVGMLCFVLSALASSSMRPPLPGEVEHYESSSSSSSSSGGGGGEAWALLGPRNRNRNSSSSSSSSGTSSPHRRRSMRGSSKLALDRLLAYEGRRRLSTIHEKGESNYMLGSFGALRSSALLSLSEFALDSLDIMDNDNNNNKSNPSLEILDDEPEASAAAPSSSYSSIETKTVGIGHYSLREVASTRTNVCLVVFTFIACFAAGNIDVLVPPYISSLGMPPSSSGRVIAMFGVGGLLSNLTMGGVADRVGIRRLFPFSLFVLSLPFFAWPHCTSTWSLSTMAFFYAFFVSPVFSMPLLVLADAFGEGSSSRHILALIGLTNVVSMPGTLLGPYLASLLVERAGGSYDTAAISSGLVMLAGALVLLMIPSPEVQQRMLAERARR